MNTGLEAPWRHSYSAPPSQYAPPDSLESQESQEDSSEESSGESEEGSGSEETKGKWIGNDSYYTDCRQWTWDVLLESQEGSSDESEESDEYSLYSDIADQEYDYDEEDYEGTEDDVMPRNLPTDPIGKELHFHLNLK